MINYLQKRNFRLQRNFQLNCYEVKKVRMIYFTQSEIIFWYSCYNKKETRAIVVAHEASKLVEIMRLEVYSGRHNVELHRR